MDEAAFFTRPVPATAIAPVQIDSESEESDSKPALQIRASSESPSSSDSVHVSIPKKRHRHSPSPDSPPNPPTLALTKHTFASQPPEFKSTLNKPVCPPSPLPSPHTSKDDYSPVVELCVQGRSVDDASSLPQDWHEPLIFKLRITQSFRLVLRALIRTKQVDPTVAESIVLSSSGRRVFGASTPSSLNLAPDQSGRIPVDAFTSNDFTKYKAAQEKERLRGVAPQRDSPPPLPTIPMKRFILRGKDTSDTKIQTALDTSASTIIESYRKMKNLPENVKLSLEFDGEDIDNDTKIGDIEDLDDQDVIIVKSL